MEEPSPFRQRLQQIRERIAGACTIAGTDPQAVKLVAVTKTVALPQLIEASEEGICDFGENYAQELQTKIGGLLGAHWHFIGHLQTNKVKLVVGQVALVQSVDSVRLARAIHSAAAGRGVVQDVLIQVRLDESVAKTGLPVGELNELLDAAAELPNVRVQGLMGVAPLEDLKDARTAFATLRGLFEQLPRENRRWLSMGMSGDYEVALQEGSNLIRLGTALFGPRQTLRK